MAERNFIGKGWSYPFRFDSRTGGVAKDQGDGVAQQLTRVRSSIKHIMSVKRGELFFARRFGSRLRNLLFALSTANLEQRLQFEVLLAIEDREFGEHRATITNVQVLVPTINNDQTRLDVTFSLNNTNAEGNLVYPLYLVESERAAAERGLSE